MIQSEQHPVYSAECDICKTTFEHSFEGWTIFLQQDGLTERMDAQGWHITDKGDCYCPKCHEIDDEDNLILKP